MLIVPGADVTRSPVIARDNCEHKVPVPVLYVNAKQAVFDEHADAQSITVFAENGLKVDVSVTEPVTVI